MPPRRLSATRSRSAVMEPRSIEARGDRTEAGHNQTRSDSESGERNQKGQLCFAAGYERRRGHCESRRHDAETKKEENPIAGEAAQRHVPLRYVIRHCLWDPGRCRIEHKQQRRRRRSHLPSPDNP